MFLSICSYSKFASSGFASVYIFVCFFCYYEFDYLRIVISNCANGVGFGLNGWIVKIIHIGSDIE